ncbi:MAG: hypothetical protein U0835_00410 [Isosphaeraceae bacterium]
MHKGQGPLSAASQGFVQSTPTRRRRTGLKAVVEITAYPDGKFALDVSTIGGPQNARTIKIANSMMLNDLDEAKDHTDAIIDHLARVAATGGGQAAQAAADDGEDA